MQIELKFRFTPEELPALRRHSLLRQHTLSKSRAYRSVCIYFDTPDFQLFKQGMTLHVMRADKRWKQILTFKQAHREWETEIATSNPDYSAIAAWFGNEPKLAHRRFDASTAARMIPLFTTNCRKIVWHLGFDQGREAELHLELVQVQSGKTTETVSELILTHRSGAVDAFFDFALALQQEFKLRVAYLVPSDTGLAMHGLAPHQAITAKRLALRADMEVEQGMRIVVQDCISHISGNAAGVLEDGKSECIHQMRVGLRRLRSALGIFEIVKPCPLHVQSELVWLSSRLGAARDWDVLCSSTIPALAGHNVDDPDLSALQKRVGQERKRAHRNAAAAVDSPRSARLWLLLEQWLNVPSREPAQDVSTGDTRPVLLRDFAAQNIQRLHKKMIRRGAAMDVAAPESRHRLRIASKKLRYATEFFISYFRKKTANRFVARIIELQDIFGASNDTVVADRLLRNLAMKNSGLSEICSRLRGYMEALDDVRLLELGRRIRRFSALKKLKLRKAALDR